MSKYLIHLHIGSATTRLTARDKTASRSTQVSTRYHHRQIVVVNVTVGSSPGIIVAFMASVLFAPGEPMVVEVLLLLESDSVVIIGWDRSDAGIGVSKVVH